MKSKTNRARHYASTALKSLIAAGRKNPSLYVKIAAEMSSRAREHFHRQEVAVWLHENPEKRIEPRLGAGLLLLRVGTSLTEKPKKAAPETIRIGID